MPAQVAFTYWLLSSCAALVLVVVGPSLGGHQVFHPNPTAGVDYSDSQHLATRPIFNYWWFPTL